MRKTVRYFHFYDFQLTNNCNYRVVVAPSKDKLRPIDFTCYKVQRWRPNVIQRWSNVACVNQFLGSFLAKQIDFHRYFFLARITDPGSRLSFTSFLLAVTRRRRYDTTIRNARTNIIRSRITDRQERVHPIIFEKTKEICPRKLEDFFNVSSIHPAQPFGWALLFFFFHEGTSRLIFFYSFFQKTAIMYKLFLNWRCKAFNWINAIF